MNRVATTIAAVAIYLACAGHGTCTSDLLDDPSFDLWCGEELCSWKVERGDIHKAATWHESDTGVELVGDDVAISQLSDVSYQDCIQFDLIADIDLDATVILEMDLFDDGEIDFSERLPTARFELLSYVVKMPERFQGIRFRLRKTGSGHAVLAQIRARRASDCEGEPLDQPVTPVGGWCVLDDDGEGGLAPTHDWCATGTCSQSQPWALGRYACSDCEQDSDCDNGVCGVQDQVPTFLDPHRSCVAPASRELGQLCYQGEECATGVCCLGVCSTCCDSFPQAECSDDRTCTQRDYDTPVRGGYIGPSQCDPGLATGLVGEACLRDDDCASQNCVGSDELSVCLYDGRTCSSDTDCPPDRSHDHDEFGTCFRFGTAGGICQ